MPDAVGKDAVMNPDSAESASLPSISAPLRVIAWLLVLCAAPLLLALAGRAVQAGHADDADTALRVADTTHARLYRADTARHAIQILNLRAGISEIGAVPLPAEAQVESIQLDASGRWLLIDTSEGRLRLDTARLALATPATRLAEEGGSLPRARRN